MPENNTIEGIKACVFDAYGTLLPRIPRKDHLRGLLYMVILLGQTYYSSLSNFLKR